MDVSNKSSYPMHPSMIHQQPPLQQQQTYIHSGYPPTGEIHPNVQQYVHQSSNFSSSYGECSNSSVAPVDVGSHPHPDQNQQKPQEMASMALQFMQAVQNSVQQVVQVPYFGFEWVKPDYQFDPLANDELMESFCSTPPQPNSVSESVEDPSSPGSMSTSSLSYNSTNENPPPPPMAALSPRTMELYEALEEFSELYG